MQLQEDRTGARVQVPAGLPDAVIAHLPVDTSVGVQAAVSAAVADNAAAAVAELTYEGTGMPYSWLPVPLVRARVPQEDMGSDLAQRMNEWELLPFSHRAKFPSADRPLPVPACRPPYARRRLPFARNHQVTVFHHLSGP